MSPEIAWIDLRLRRRSMLWFALGTAVYTFVIVAMYPTIKDDSSLSALVKGNETAAALFGVSGSLTSPVGWVNGNLYTNFLPLLVLLLTIGYGAAAIAGQSEDGTLSLAATLPVSRTRIVLEKAFALAVVALPLAVATTLTVLVGREYQLDLAVSDVVGTTLAVLLLGLDFGLLALAIGAATGRRGLALALSSAVAAASYLVSSLAPVIDWANSVRWTSLFFWSVGDNQLGVGPAWADYAVLLGVGVALLLAAIALVRRLDIP